MQRAQLALEAPLVLVVDDTPVMLALYGHSLTSAGYRVSTADNGPAALQLLEAQTPDLIVLDFMMPGMDGIEVLRRIRTDPRLAPIPVVMLTASGCDENIAQAFDLGVTDYLTKPIDRRIFTARVRGLIDGRRDRDVAVRSATMEREHGRLLEEVKQAQSVQRAQLPTTPSRAGRWLAVGSLVPSDEVGGDLFDVVEGPNGTRTAVLIDVSGHGLAAAMVASGLRGTVRLLLRSMPLDRVLEELNRQLCEVDDGHYACVALVQLDGSVVTVANAGLPPVVLIERGREFGRVEGGGVPPGMLPGSTYTMETFQARPGTRIVLASDGLTEPFGHADATDEYLLRLGLMQPWREESTAADTLRASIRALFSAGAGAQTDDCTVLALDFLDPIRSGSSAVEASQ